MKKLIKLQVDLGNNNIDNSGYQEIVDSLVKLSKLEKVSLMLDDNMIKKKAFQGSRNYQNPISGRHKPALGPAGSGARSAPEKIETDPDFSPKPLSAPGNFENSGYFGVDDQVKSTFRPAS